MEADASHISIHCEFIPVGLSMHQVSTWQQAEADDVHCRW